ncbi:flagellar motor protein MotB [Parasphingorhabdus cellanae]|uniref:OmpA family protein n=1 Tax=Parasphingorhabdus cellanae TaxID=2806553 RepID=A0ABX7T1J2_9SPHN|nr:flagellar motor protein MotB [Parasphingorhabdus cellanae]QTD55429.1 OmpA family protein [Parasphingorhabdus cellanae]
MAKKAAPEPVQPIIVKKIIMEEHSGHHGGAWKVAYADFVTAMMAFFLLMWLLGATDEKQRKGIADYFAPTLAQVKRDSAGGKGMFGGSSVTDPDKYPHPASNSGTAAMSVPRNTIGVDDERKGRDGGKEGKAKSITAKEFEERIREQLKNDPANLKLLSNVRFTDTKEGLRIDIIDEADFSMFALATDKLKSRATELIGQVAKIIDTVDNELIIRGHTDSLPYASGKSMNNWLLSSGRAEATMQELVRQGVSIDRMARIEGVADTEPYNPQDRMDDRNRRISITMKTS